MKLKNIMIILLVLFSLASLLIYIEPSITGLVAQERLLVYNISVSAEQFEQKINVEQFDDYEVKLDDALYYFTADVKEKQEVNYIIIEFIVDSSQIREYTREEVSLYYFNESWIKLETEFIRQDGRFYYYKAKAYDFGLFSVAPRKEAKEAVIPRASNKELILFGLLPIFCIILLFSVLSYGSARLLAKINFRVYLLFKKGAIGLSKFVFSFGVVLIATYLLSYKASGEIYGAKLIYYYAFIPLFSLSLIFDLFLNLILWVHRAIASDRFYKLARNLFWMFLFLAVIILGLLYKITPEAEGELGSSEIILYGIIPIAAISFGASLSLYGLYALARKIIVRT